MGCKRLTVEVLTLDATLHVSKGIALLNPKVDTPAFAATVAVAAAQSGTKC